MMNRRQKLVQQQFLNNEKEVINRLEHIYDVALTDITDKISDLDKSIGYLQKVYDGIDEKGGLNGIAFEYFNKMGAGQAKYYANHPEKARELLQSAIQSKVYQKNYQQVLQDQVGGVLDQMLAKEFLTIADYLDKCYEDGFVGSLFDLHGQDIPLIMPMNQESMVRAVQLDSKISQGLYTRLGEDIDKLKKRITAEVSRSIATGASYGQTAKRLANQTRIGYNNAIRIARTEGHRIQTTAAMDVAYQAKEKGADILKQWDAALDAKTRESHVHVDGEIREVDEKFSNGLMYPGDPAGGAAEVVNCRCALLQRARWALDEDELQTLKDRAAYYGLDKSEQFDDFKKKYLKAVADDEPVADSAFIPAKSIAEAEKYAKRFADYVSYKGATDLDAVNDVNKALQRLQEICPIDNLSQIATNGRLTSTNAQANFKKLEIGTKWLNKVRTEQPTDWVARVARNKEKIAQYMPFTDAKKYPRDTVKLYTKFVKELTEECKYNRWTVSSSVGSVFSTISHEYGHIVADQYFGQINGKYANPNYFSNPTLYAQKAYVQDVFKTAKKNGDIYGISMYAATDEYEFFAETFSMYMIGEPLPDYIEEMLMKVIMDGKL